MKICIVTHRLLKGDGQARVNYELVRELQKRNHHVTLLASDVDPVILSKPKTNWVKVPVKGWPTQLLKDHIFAIISTLKLFMLRNQFDLIMVNGFITWIKSDVNAVHYVHSSWLESPAHPFNMKKNIHGIYQFLFTYINSIFEKIAFSRTLTLVPVSEKVKKEVEEMGFRDNVRVIFNGVDIEEFTPYRKATREQLGLPVNVPIALFAGDIKSSRKNLDTVLKALVSLKDLHLVVAGSTRGSPFIKLSSQLGVSERVHFLGFRTDMPDIMNNADFFVFPSRYEACSLAVIEALASGLPVITTGQSGMSEFIHSTPKAGIVFDDPEDVNELRQAMELLVKDAELRRQMGANARLIAERHSWKSVAGKYVELFEEVAARKSVNKAFRRGDWVEL